MSHVLDGHLCIMSDFIHNQILKDVNVDDTFYKVCKVCTISVQDFFKVEHFFDSIAKLQTKTQTMVAFYFSKVFFALPSLVNHNENKLTTVDQTNWTGSERVPNHQSFVLITFCPVKTQ